MQFENFILKEEKKDYYKKLMDFIDLEYKNNLCHPDRDLIFRAFLLTPFENVKVVILGQDPYHEINQAHGIAFSVLCDKLPPSLKNIYKEMRSDLNIDINQDGNLEYLANQGVLLMNTVLTVRNGEANSHKDKGWEIFTDNVIKELENNNNPIVYILWGNKAKDKKKLITNPNHYIIESEHPSPLSANRGFFGSKPFSKTNDILIKNGIEPIKWVK